MNDPRIGQTVLDDYVVTKKLAEGGMGAVYLAVHPSGMRRVVKYMLAECLQQPAIRARWERECAAAVRLEGREGIVRIDTFSSNRAEPYIVMEYLDGHTLDEHIRRNGQLTPHHTFRIAVQILGALAALHEEGIIHRDLKPSNVFVLDTKDAGAHRTKLIDFGIVHDQRAAATGDFKTREGQVIGTPGYMATEQYGHADKVTPATDVFACAVIIWEMLTGQLPWGVAPNEFAQHERQARETPVWPATMPLPFAEEWPAVLISALSPRIGERPQTAQAFALMLGHRLRAQPPFVQSGVEMIEKLVPRFLQNVPAELETVRHPNASAALLWPPNPSVTPSAHGTPAPVTPPAAASIPPYATDPTVGGRPTPATGGVPAHPLTTISGSTGVSSIASTPPRASRTGAFVAIGIASAVIVGGGAFVVSRSQSGAGRSAHETSTQTEDRGVMLDAGTVTASQPPPPDAGVAVVIDASIENVPIATPTTVTTKPTTSRQPSKTKLDEKRKTSATPTETKPHPESTATGSGSASKKPFDLDGVKE